MRERRTGDGRGDRPQHRPGTPGARSRWENGKPTARKTSHGGPDHRIIILEFRSFKGPTGKGFDLGFLKGDQNSKALHAL
jgi:hypothetical protein